MSKTLRDSLDLYHRVVATMTIQIQKLEKLGISPSQTIIAIMLIVMGLICYYFAPQAFLNDDPQLFLAIINMTLMLLILGLTLILSLIEVPLENLILNTIFFFNRRDRNLKKIVFKNMDAHRRRNEKTTIMYSIALAFLIFTGTGFNLQTESIAQILASTIAADIKVMIPLELSNYLINNYLSRE
jgi:predicted cation transporter